MEFGIRLHGFVREKLYLIKLITFWDRMILSVGEQREGDIA